MDKSNRPQNSQQDNQQDYVRNQQNDGYISDVPNSFANAWNNLIPKKIPPVVEDKELNDENIKKLIWKNFNIKYIIENFRKAPVRFKIVIFVLAMVLLGLIGFLALAIIGFNASQRLKALTKDLVLIESKSKLVTNETSPVFPSELEVKDKVNPLNGELFATSDFNRFSETRPYAVSIDNAVLSRSQMSGLYSADIVYEFPVEGNTSRFLGIFWSKKPSIIGPVRSIRPYMMDILPDNDAILSHYGQSTLSDATKTYKEIEIPFVDSIAYFSKYNVEHTECGIYQEKSLLDLGTPVEHTYFNNISTLNGCIPSGWVRKPNLISYLFKTDLVKDQRPLISELSIDRGNPNFLTRWIYDSEKNVYKRYQAQKEHEERELGILTTKNIILQYTQIININDSQDHIGYTMVGEGDAVFMFDGKVTRGKWVKTSRNVRTKYYNSAGEEIRFNRGKFWIYALPTDKSSINANVQFK